jgi:exodeoxyribonuclease VII large subunit
VKRVGDRRVWSVAEVSAAIARRFEDIPPLWIEGEIRDLRQRGGQVYFGLSDQTHLAASMNAIVFDRLMPAPRDGERVHVYGRPQFWPPRGEVSVRVERVDRVGEGALRAQIEALRGRLEREGLLDSARKRALPLLPRRVGLVTSAAGAARDDFLRNAWQRFSRASVVAVDVPVQGEYAPEAIASALERLAEMPEVDVVVVTRGGGSLEDLMGFNTEVVARAIAACRVPVVSAVGHERDVTLADLVADRRVSTPTAAASVVVPDEAELGRRLGDLELRMRERLVGAARERRIELRRLSDATRRALDQHVSRRRDRLAGHRPRIAQGARSGARQAQATLDHRRERLIRAMGVLRADAAARLDKAASLLAAVSPGATVDRGYAIVRGGRGAVVVSARGHSPGEPLELEMKDGRLPVTVRTDER